MTVEVRQSEVNINTPVSDLVPPTDFDLSRMQTIIRALLDDPVLSVALPANFRDCTVRLVQELGVEINNHSLPVTEPSPDSKAGGPAACIVASLLDDPDGCILVGGQRTRCLIAAWEQKPGIFTTPDQQILTEIAKRSASVLPPSWAEYLEKRCRGCLSGTSDDSELVEGDDEISFGNPPEEEAPDIEQEFGTEISETTEESDKVDYLDTCSVGSRMVT